MLSWRRRAADVIARYVAFACTVAVLVPLALILGYLMKQGITAVDLDFFTRLPKPVGEAGGGMANAIVGTLILIGLACAMGLPIGVMAGVYIAEHRNSRLASAIRFSADVMGGVPSIVV